MKQSISLFGPFIGSTSWEFYRFAPLMIYFKKLYRDKKIAVLTRPERFDLYGQYADFLIPLKIDEDDEKNQICFTIKNFKLEKYIEIIRKFNLMYSKRFFVDEHYFPDISDFRYKIKWQFSKSNMCYDFKPRVQNSIIINKFTKSKNSMLIIPPDEERFHKISKFINNNDLSNKFSFFSFGYSNEIFQDINLIEKNKEVSKIGLLIEILKNSVVTIAPKSDITHLSLLLKVPVLTWGNKLNINMINPFKTEISMFDSPPSFEIINKFIERRYSNHVKNSSSYNRI